MRKINLIAATALVLLLGCQSGQNPLPTVFSVKGKVVDEKGKAVTDGMVQFESTTDGNLTVAGPIQSDGSFTLKSFRDRQEQAGVPEGEYRAVVTLPLKDNAAPDPVHISKTCKVEAKENYFELQFGK